MQVDGSWDKQSKHDGTGWAIPYDDNKNNNSVDGGGTYGLANSSLHVEAKARLQALQWCIAKGTDEVLMLTDIVTLINNLSNSKAEDIPMQWKILEIKELTSTCKICVILKADRQ